jgi:hypothetical protein
VTIDRNTRSLANLFFGRLFENDVFSSSAAATSSLTYLVALVAVPGVMFRGSEVFRWAHLYAMAERLQDPSIVDGALLMSQVFHIDFVMAVAGLVTMLVWSSLTPDRKDALVLGPLPTTTREQAYGRLLALLKFFGMFIVAVSVPTGIMFTFVSVAAQNIADFPGRVTGHIAGAVLAGGFVFFLLLNTQLLLAALFGPRAIRFITLPLQLASILGMVAALASAEGFARALLADGAAATGLMWNPAAWFVGVYRWISGDERALFTTLAERGLVAGVGSIVCALILYPLAYGRCLRNVIASEGLVTGGLQRGWATLAARLMRPLLRTPPQRSLGAFMMATLGRSHTHRFIIGMYGGIAFLTALPVVGRAGAAASSGGVRWAAFAISLGVVFWLVCGVRVALMMPVDVIANWTFKITEPVDKRRVLTTVVTVMAFVTCVPVAVIGAAGALAWGDTALAIALLAIVPLAGLCLIEMLTLTMRTVPFTCTYLPGQLRLRVFWPLYFFLWLNFVFRTSRWGYWAIDDSWRVVQVSAFFLAVWGVLRTVHMIRARKIGAFVYDEQEQALVTTMDIATQLKRI